jgi:hypothetical protein
MLGRTWFTVNHTELQEQVGCQIGRYYCRNEKKCGKQEIVRTSKAEDFSRLDHYTFRKIFFRYIHQMGSQQPRTKVAE